MDPVEVHIHKVSAARPVQVGQKETFGIKVDFEMGRIFHRDALAELAITQVGPVIDATVMDQDDVIQTASGQVGQTDSARGIVKKDVWELVEVVLARDVLRRGKTPFRPDIRTKGNPGPGSSGRPTSHPR